MALAEISPSALMLAGVIAILVAVAVLSLRSAFKSNSARQSQRRDERKGRK